MCIEWSEELTHVVYQATGCACEYVQVSVTELCSNFLHHAVVLASCLKVNHVIELEFHVKTICECPLHV